MAPRDPSSRLGSVPDVVTPDGLYGLEPSAFIPARDALVRHLRRQGEREAAAEVAALRRPTPSVWALNSLARAEPDRIDQVLAAAADVGGALAEGGDRLRAAQSAYREVVEDAVVTAATLADVDGETNLSRIRDTLLAAGADPEVARMVAAGTLRADHDPPGFAAGAAGGAIVRRGASRRTPSGRGARPKEPATPKDTATSKDSATSKDPATPKDTATSKDTAAARRTARAAEARARERSRLVDRLADLTTRADELAAIAQEAEHVATEARRAADESRDQVDRAADRLDRFDHR